MGLSISLLKTHNIILMKFEPNFYKKIIFFLTQNNEIISFSLYKILKFLIFTHDINFYLNFQLESKTIKIHNFNGIIF